MKGQVFESAEDARRCFEGLVADIPEVTWRDVTTKWFERMTKCIRAEGGYIEKLD